VATIDLNNLVRPKQVNNPYTKPSERVEVVQSVYTDLHFDLTLAKSIGVGTSPSDTNDILVDNDVDAIKNSIRNIFTVRKGQKLLNPEFGSSLEQYLFEPITEIYARAIGDDILSSIEKYEPRIEVLKVLVLPNPDENQYNIGVSYKFLEFKKENVLNIIAQLGGQISI
jgi:phage baseplate assembly protein W